MDGLRSQHRCATRGERLLLRTNFPKQTVSFRPDLACRTPIYTPVRNGLNMNLRAIDQRELAVLSVERERQIGSAQHNSFRTLIAD